MTAPNTTQTPGGAPAIPFDQLSELEQQATLCSLALNEKDGLLDGSEVAWGGTPRTVDEQKALLAANHDKAVAIMTAVLASPKGRDVLPVAWPAVPEAPVANPLNVANDAPPAPPAAPAPVALEPAPIPLTETEKQAKVDRLHQLLDSALNKLAAFDHIVVHEAKALLSDLGLAKSEEPSA